MMPNLYRRQRQRSVSGMVGGLGGAPRWQHRQEGGRVEPIPRSAPTHAGQERANPVRELHSGALMLASSQTQRQKRVEKHRRNRVISGREDPTTTAPIRDPSKAASHDGDADAIIASH